MDLDLYQIAGDCVKLCRHFFKVRRIPVNWDAAQHVFVEAVKKHGISPSVAEELWAEARSKSVEVTDEFSLCNR